MTPTLTSLAAADFADLVPGALEVVNALRARPEDRFDTRLSRRVVCGGALAAGRPSPPMMYRSFTDLGVWPTCCP